MENTNRPMSDDEILASIPLDPTPRDHANTTAKINFSPVVDAIIEAKARNNRPGDMIASVPVSQATKEWDWVKASREPWSTKISNNSEYPRGLPHGVLELQILVGAAKRIADACEKIAETISRGAKEAEVSDRVSRVIEYAREIGAADLFTLSSEELYKRVADLTDLTRQRFLEVFSKVSINVNNRIIHGSDDPSSITSKDWFESSGISDLWEEWSLILMSVQEVCRDQLEKKG